MNLEQINRLKSMTMKPHIFAESILAKLEVDLMSARWEGDKFLAEQIAKQITSIKTQLYVEQLQSSN
jgi:hypothetical protein